MNNGCYCSVTDNRDSDLLFENHDHFVFVVVRIVQVEQLGMTQIVHDVDFVPHQMFICWIGCVDELGNEGSARGLLHRPVNHTEGSSAIQNQIINNISFFLSVSHTFFQKKIIIDPFFGLCELSFHSRS